MDWVDLDFFHHLAQFPCRFCQVSICHSRTGQPVEWQKQSQLNLLSHHHQPWSVQPLITLTWMALCTAFACRRSTGSPCARGPRSGSPPRAYWRRRPRAGAQTWSRCRTSCWCRISSARRWSPSRTCSRDKDTVHKLDFMNELLSL